MNREELVNALRGCVGGGNPCKACALYGKMGCVKILNDAAADEIERLQYELDRSGMFEEEDDD